MSTALQDAIGVILDNYSDVIEGGNSHRGSGTAYNGIPGTRSHHELASTTLTVDASGLLSTTAIVADDISDARAALLVRADAPPMFLRALTGTAGNIGAARRITGYAAATNLYTLGTALPSTPTAADIYSVDEGFVRALDSVDFEEGPAEEREGRDRVFHLSALPGERLDWYGNGTQQFKTTLILRLRLLTRARMLQTAASALENIQRLNTLMTSGDFREGTYTQALISREAATTPIKTALRVVAEQKFDLVYRVTSTIL